MRIVEIEIEDLFGTFHHRIPLNTDDRVTIIHGPNGFGKTILLEMVHGLFHGRYAKLRRIPFRQLAVGFDDGKRVLVLKEAIAAVPETEESLELTQDTDLPDDVSVGDRGSERSLDYEIKLALRNGDRNGAGKPEEFKLSFEGAPGFPLRYIERELPHLEPIGGQLQFWFDPTTHEELSLDEVLAVYRQALPHQTELFLAHSSARDGEPPWWRDIRRSVRVEMIREQRLRVMRAPWARTRRREATLVPAVSEYSDELARTLQKKLAESVELSQSLDRTFPARLLKRIHERGPTDLELTEKLAELERKRKQLRDAGLLAEQQDMPLLPTEGLGEETRDVLAVYVEDAERKLSIFDDLARKIELFQSIINSRFLYKHLRISRRNGFVFTARSEEHLPLSALSSGEQQEIVLLYELLFRVKPNSLVLIDEPEISLHVAWQKRFLEDLTRITELASFDVLIATHSPQIIHKRWDLTVELESPGAEAELETVSLS